MLKLTRILFAVYLFSICRPLSAAEQDDDKSDILSCFTQICKPQKVEEETSDQRTARVREKMRELDNGKVLAELKSLYGQYLKISELNFALSKTRLAKLAKQIDRLTPMQRRIYQSQFYLDGLAEELAQRATSVKRPVNDLEWLNQNRAWNYVDDFKNGDWRNGVSIVLPLERFNFQGKDFLAWSNPWPNPNSVGDRWIPEMIPLAEMELNAVEAALGKDFYRQSMTKARRAIEMAKASGWKSRRDIMEILSTFSFIHFAYLAVTLPEMKALEQEPVAVNLDGLDTAVFDGQDFSSYEEDLATMVMVTSFPNKNKAIDAQSKTFKAAETTIAKRFTPEEAGRLIPAMRALKYQRPLSIEDVLKVAEEDLRTAIAKLGTENLTLVNAPLSWGDILDLVQLDRRYKKAQVYLRANSGPPLRRIMSLYTTYLSSFYLHQVSYLDLKSPRFIDEVDPVSLAHELGHFVYFYLREQGGLTSPTSAERISEGVRVHLGIRYPSVTNESYFEETASEDFADAFSGLVAQELEPHPEVSDSFMCKIANKSDAREISIKGLQTVSAKYSHIFFRILNFSQMSKAAIPNSCNNVTWDRLIKLKD